jgi:diguanylate cyclase (GGDEF)-like protein/PAS domain S-box-containing protein
MLSAHDKKKAGASTAHGTYSFAINLIAWVVIAMGTWVLASWVFDIEAGKSLLPGFQTMKVNTSLCFIACGSVLWLRASASGPACGRLIAVCLSWFIFVVSGLTMIEYASGWQLGIDNLVIMDTATAPDNWPGRMSMATALCFGMIGAAWLASIISTRYSALILQLFALSVAIISGAGLIGYAFGVEQFRLPLFSTMALHTAFLFVIYGLGMLFVRPGEALMSPATSRYLGGRSLRRLLPFIGVIPILTSWLSMQGVLSAHYSEAFGFALSSLSSILILGFVSWLGANALNYEEERFRSTIDASPVATIMVDSKGVIRIANRFAHTLFRSQAPELVGRSIEHLIPARFHQAHERYHLDYMRQAEERMMGKGRELFARREDGSEFRAEIALNPVQMADGRYVMAAVVDVTERVESEQKILRLNRTYKVLSGINSLIVRVQTRDALCEEATRITVEVGGLPVALVVQHDRASGQCEILFGHAVEKELEARHLSEYETEAIRECLERHHVVLRNDLAEQHGSRNLMGLVDLGIRSLAAIPLTPQNHSLELAFVLYQHEPFAFDQLQMELLKEVASDISFAINNLTKNQQLKYLTHYDSITDLPNRLLMTDRLKQALSQCDREHSLASILYIDIDRFKQVNDSLGHTGGDEVLRQVTQRINSCVNKADTVSRWGGDEFIVLLPGKSAADAAGIANAITGALHSLIVLGEGQELFVSCSIGIAEYPCDGSGMDELINSARSAMTAIKEHGGNDYRQFVLESNHIPVDRLALETSLRHALEQKQFQLHYQPQIDIVSGQVVGLEALLRWYHPTQGIIAPDRFIPLAEKTGLIIPIGEWVLREACRQATSQPGLKVAVNLSARQFHQQDLVAMIRRILDETGMLPSDLELEITESALIYDVELAITTMEQLKDLGVSISLDDFGTGYSSLSYLKRFPIDMLKIDKSFIDEVTTDPGSQVIVKTIIVMAQSLGLKVIAEGVETKEQLAMLHEHGCDQVQGYLIARPLPWGEALRVAAQAQRQF